LQKKISKTNTELTTLFTKVIHLQKTLNQTNHHATEKTYCLAVELDNDNDETKNENDFFDMQQFVDFILLIF